MYVLNLERRVEIGAGMIQSMMRVMKTPDWRPPTFKDWIYDLFGETIGREYLEPYNWKIWKRNFTTLDTDWVFSPGKLTYPGLKDIIASIAGIESVGYKE